MTHLVHAAFSVALLIAAPAALASDSVVPPAALESGCARGEQEDCPGRR